MDKKGDQRLTALTSLFQMYADVQLRADTNDYNRTSVFTLIQGLMIVGFEQAATSADLGPFGLMIAITGVVLSVAWLFVEQRTLLYFQARARILRGVEQAVQTEFQKTLGIKFHPFWTVGESFIYTGSSWYQRASAQKILRLGLPMLFLALWASLGLWTAFAHEVSTQPTEVRIVPSDGVTAPGSDPSPVSPSPSILRPTE